MTPSPVEPTRFERVCFVLTLIAAAINAAAWLFLIFIALALLVLH